MLFFDDQKIKDLIAQLKAMSDRALPYAARFYLNGVAFRHRKHWQDEIKTTFIQRNQFTVRSVRVETTRSLNLRTMETVTGSIADYMDDQEFGGTKTPRRGDNVNIPTARAAGQARGTNPRTRTIRKHNKLMNVRLKKGRITAQSKRQRNLIAVKEAVKSGRRFVYLSLNDRQGIFRVTGSKKRPKVDMVHDLSRKSITITKEPTNQRSLQHTSKDIPLLARDALTQQIDRQTKYKRR